MHVRTVYSIALAVTLALGALMTLCPPRTAGAATSLSSVVLKKSDVPAGYVLTSSKADTIQSQAQSDQVSVGTLRGKGWLGTFTSNFVKGSSAARIQINSSVDLFKSASGVSWDRSNGLRVIRRYLTHVRTFPVPGLGQQALGVTASGTLQRVPYALVFIVFRRGDYLASPGITVTGKISAAPSLTQVERYAAIMDGRIKHG